MRSGRQVAVIGAGLGGLSAAALLARGGLQVTVFEKGCRAGGKMNVFAANGFTWDTGPSLVTMPHVLRGLWRKLGRDFDRDLQLIRLEPSCRYFWPDQHRVDEDEAFWQRPDLTRLLRHAAGIYDVSAEAFLEHRLEDWWKQLHWKNLPKLRHLPKVADRRTLAQLAADYFADKRLRQYLGRFATYNGSSPYRAPAAFSIIPYVQRQFGSWYVKGGLYRIADALAQICREEGARFEFGTEIFRVQPNGRGFTLATAGGTVLGCDLVICNQDVLSADAQLFPPPFRTGYASQRRDLAVSGFAMLLGVRGNHPGLLHHNVFFSDDYETEFRQIFDQRTPPAPPTIYVAIDSKTEPERAPAGHENWFVLVNVPAFRGPDQGKRWERASETYGNLILRRLSAFGFDGLENRVVDRHYLSPLDFARRFNAFGGSLYGFASHGLFSAFRRPPLQSRRLPNLWFVGGSTHPGGGIPLSLLSGRIVAEEVLR
ncbi:MAG: phytoene desaturase [Verrucomicrobia bacterium]|nr:phytoene desaturase [Verrucomicrobiota bacterium]